MKSPLDNITFHRCEPPVQCSDCGATVYHYKGCNVAKAEVTAMERNMAKTFSGKLKIVNVNSQDPDQIREQAISLEEEDIAKSLSQFSGKDVIITIFEVIKH